MKRVFSGYTTLLVFGLLVAFVTTSFAGRGDKSGTSAAPELLIPVGARDIALAGSSLAWTTGIDAIYWNPAGLSRTDHGAEAVFSNMSYIADISVQYVGIATTFEGFGTLGLTLKSISIGDMEITTEDVPDGTGQIFSPTYVTLGLTYSRLLTDRISIGLTTNFISERIDRVSATGVAFNFGVQYSGFAGVSGLNIGVAAKNIGPPMKFDGSGLLREASVTDILRPASFYKIEAQSDELPSTVELGISYGYKLEETSVFTVSSIFQNQNLSDDEYKIGLEYGYDNTLFVRGGYNFTQESRPGSYLYGATAGAGIHYAFSGLDVTVDYAYRHVKFLEPNHMFSIKLGF